MDPAQLAVLGLMVIASVISLARMFVTAARWAPAGTALELRPPSERTDRGGLLAGAIFIATLIAAGALGGLETAALALGIVIVATTAVTAALALLRPATFRPTGQASAPTGEADAAAGGVALVGGRDAYDVFVSYKSQDAQVAREVVDRLLASGHSVWFAEYEILLAGRDQFQRAILDGIARSHRGIALTNDRYAASEHCRLEMTELLERVGPANIIEARLPVEEGTHQIFPRLRESPQVSATSSEDVLAFVRSETGWDIRPAVAAGDGGPRPVEGRAPSGRYVLDASGWEVVEGGGERLAEGTIKGPVLRYERADHRLDVNIYAGPESAPQAKRPDRGADDREMYDFLIDYLPHHVGRLGADIRGVHLFFHGGLSQMAATYRLAGFLWIRKHSVILPHPRMGEPTEFVFTFGFPGTFAEYCRSTQLMDHLVTTLEWVA